MTLTFAYIDGRYAVHVADRRISVRETSTGEMKPKHDDAVKMVAPRGSMLLSYTGAADLRRAANEPGDTALWLKAKLESVKPEAESGLAQVAEDLTQLFAEPEYATRKLTVTITGWAQVGEGNLQPWVAGITNRNPDTKARLDDFLSEHVLVDPLRGGWLPTGVSLSEEAHARVDTAIQRAAPQSVGAEVIANIFLHAIRRESTPKNGVSKKAVGVVYPLALAEHAVASGQPEVQMTIMDDGLLMGGSCATSYAPENVNYFEMIDPRDLDWSQMQVIPL